MRGSDLPAPSFSWRPLILACAFILALFGWFTWDDYSSTGRLEFFMPLCGLWIVAFLAYRWHKLRLEMALGRFSLERYRNDPGRYLLGPRMPLYVSLVALLSILVTWLVFTTPE
jgi:hypothetical protein